MSTPPAVVRRSFPVRSGTAGLFCFLPNPNLRPEVGKNKEAGLNLKYNDVFSSGDSFRGKFNVFRNDVSDYIDLVGSTPRSPILVPAPGLFSQFFQYQNIAQARIEGVEAETMYDAGLWYVGVAGHLIRGKNVATNVGLATITPRKITTTGGVRLLDRRLILAAQWSSFGANNDVPVGYLPSTGYELVNLYLTWNATKDIVFSASIDNLLNQYYRPYAIPGSSNDGTHAERRVVVEPRTGQGLQGRLEDPFWRSIVRRADKPIKLHRAALMLQRGFGASMFPTNSNGTPGAPQQPSKEISNVYRNEPVPGEDWL